MTTNLTSKEAKMGKVMRHTLGASLNIRHFFFNDTATTEIYTLSLHDALPISHLYSKFRGHCGSPLRFWLYIRLFTYYRSEEHTSELQSRLHLVCRLLLEKKKPARKPRWERSCGIRSAPV